MSTLEEVTQFLIDGATDPVPNEVDAVQDDAQDDVPNEVDDAQDDADDAQDDEIIADDETLGEDDTEEDHDDEDSEDTGDAPELDDDTIIKVQVDGETRELTLADLKANYSGEGAIQARLQAATELRKKASASVNTAVESAQRMQTATLNIIEHIDKAMHAPMVHPPEESLRQTSPQTYLRQLEAYQKDQIRIKEGREQFAKIFKDQGAAIEAAQKQHRDDELAQLSALVPAFANPKTREAVAKDLISVGRHYGFTDAEIGSMSDHRLYIMALDAHRYQQLKARGGKAVPLPKEVDSRRTPKKPMRPGTKKSSKTRAAKAQETARQQAAKSGSPDDVAAFLVAKHTAKQKGGRRGR